MNSREGVPSLIELRKSAGQTWIGGTGQIGVGGNRLATLPESKKTSFNAKSLPYPAIMSLGAAHRAQRHVADSITTLRLRLSVALATSLSHCPYCNWIGERLNF